MDFKYTDKELAVLNEKFKYPHKTVICPRCGQELQYRKIGNSCEVKCRTENCLYDAIRGL